MADLLLLDTDPHLGESLQPLLRRLGHHLVQRRDAQAALLAAYSGHYDLIVLNPQLPAQQDLNLLNRLRRRLTCPILMLTEPPISEKYATENINFASPCSSAELISHIEALLRKVEMEKQTRLRHSSPVLQVGELVLQCRDFVCLWRGQPLALTDTEFRLLAVLLENQGEALSKNLLYQQVLNRAFSRYDRTLDMHMSNLRRKLQLAGHPRQWLETVRGVGYRYHIAHPLAHAG